MNPFNIILKILLQLIRKRAFTIRECTPIGFLREAEYRYPEGDPLNKINIGEDISFELRWCCELRQSEQIGNKLSISLPAGTLKLQIVGWGCCSRSSSKRFAGSLSDADEIGKVTFSGTRPFRTSTIKVFLPAYIGDENILKLADANPVVSGVPTELEVRAAGMLGLYKFPYNFRGHMYWEKANLWASEVRVPPWARSAEMFATNGIIHLVHIQTTGLRRFLAWIPGIKMLLPVEGTSRQAIQQNPSLRVEQLQLSIKDAERLHTRSPSNRAQREEWSSQLVEAGLKRMTLSHMGYDRQINIENAVEDFLRAGLLVKPIKIRKCSAYYANAFYAMAVLGDDNFMLFRYYDELMHQFRKALDLAKQSGKCWDALRDQVHIGWLNLETAYLAKKYLIAHQYFPQGSNLAAISNQARDNCWKYYHEELANSVLGCEALKRLEIAKNELDTLLHRHGDVLDLQDRQESAIRSTRDQIAQRIKNKLGKNILKKQFASREQKQAVVWSSLVNCMPPK